MNIETFILLVFYIFPMLVLFYIAYRIFVDKNGNYPAGGSFEVIALILVSFIPGLNLMISFLVGGEHIVRKLMNKYHGK